VADFLLRTKSNPAKRSQRPLTYSHLGESVERVLPRPEWETCVVAASGPSLTAEAAEAVAASGLPVLAVNDAYKRLPSAAALYACDDMWWIERAGAADFAGERWSSTGRPGRFRHNDKSRVQTRYGVRLIFGEDGAAFSTDPETIHYGSNSGFQAVNLALHFGARHILLIGFDMQGTHFFGEHKPPLRNTGSYVSFIRAFDVAAKKLSPDIEIVNMSPVSKLNCFPKVPLDAAIAQACRRRLAA